MLVIAALVGVISSFGGYYLAVWLDASVAAAIATVLGIEFTLVFLFAPQNGVLIKRFKH